MLGMYVAKISAATLPPNSLNRCVAMRYIKYVIPVQYSMFNNLIASTPSPNNLITTSLVHCKA